MKLMLIMIANFHFFHFFRLIDTNGNLTDTEDNSFSNQWSFTILDAKIFKSNILNLYIAKSYAANFVEICTVYVELTVITVVKRYASMLNCVEFR